MKFYFCRHYIINFISPSLITFIPCHQFCLRRINKLNGVDEFASDVGYTTECNGDGGCNATKHFPVLSI